jgi:serine/threonine protein kinase
VRPSSEGGNKRSGSRYVLGDLLGRGGMAEVFAGYAVGDHGFQKPVAIKRLLPELANDDVFVERLIEEAKLLVGIQHGHIVSVLDLAREGDDVFLVMEFVDGPSLRQLIKARGARGLSLGVATYIVQSAAAGLEFTHARPGGAIIHADISPSNLLLTTSGEVRVADFGIARREGLGHGVVEGKWAYMAPEQARGEPLTPRSDVFALGVVLYELLTGQHPFGRAVTPNERDAQIQVIPPRVVKPSVPPGLDAICMRALAHAPRDRYGRMQQLIDALVEERFSSGLREGAADLAQAIREVAPRSEVGAPRTMHTERPVTLMTRSLLRDVTPAQRPSRPSRPSRPPPVAPPTELPSSDEFAVRPTIAIDAAPVPESPADEFPPVPSSGAQTVARIADQMALAQAAQAAQAMLAARALGALNQAGNGFNPAGNGFNPAGNAFHPAGNGFAPAGNGFAPAGNAFNPAGNGFNPAGNAFNPAALRADGTPMPPFRMSYADVRGDELASVVGGHTMSHGAGVAVESRGHRWTLVVLGLAAVIGAITAIIIQLTPAERAEALSERPPVAARLTAEPPRPSVAAETPARPDSRDDRELAPRVPPPQAPSAIPDPSPATPPAGPGAQDTAAPGGVDPDPKPAEARGVAPATGDEKSGEPRTSDGKATDGKATDGKATDGKATDGKATDGKATDGKTTDGKVADGKATDGKATDGKATDGKTTDGKVADGKATSGKAADTRSGEGRSSGRRSAGGRESSKRKGILAVESSPWAWVLVDIDPQYHETPAKFYLDPGVHTIKLVNDSNGRTRYARVTIEPDKLSRLDVNMD